MPVDERRLRGLGNQRGDILDLALDRIRLGVGALAAAASVEVVDGESSRELARQWDVEAVISQRPADDDQRGSLAGLLVRDARSVT